MVLKPQQHDERVQLQPDPSCQSGPTYVAGSPSLPVISGETLTGLLCCCHVLVSRCCTYHWCPWLQQAYQLLFGRMLGDMLVVVCGSLVCCESFLVIL